MALTAMQRGVRWALIIGGILLVVYWFRQIITPYIIGLALAYFLDPVADWMEKHGFRRIVAVTLITLVALGVILLVILIALPLAFTQLAELISNLPGFLERINGVIIERFPQFAEFESGLVKRISQSTDQIIAAVSNWLLNSTASLFSWIAAIVIVPTVAFYMLYSWDHMTEVVESWVPRDNLSSYRYLTGKIDVTLSGFLRGQGSVCIIMAIYYSTVLTLLGLNFGFVIGLIAGFLTFIPMVGGLVGGILVVGVGFFQYIIGDGGNWGYYLLVLLLYFGGQSFEGNFLTPRLVGNSVGLHPVWVMFALSAGALAMGFTGMLIAIPVAAVIGVIGRYLLDVYKHGPLYLGEDFDEHAYNERRKKRRSGEIHTDSN